MASEQIPKGPELCVKGCGFYGNTATGGLCSKCYRDSLKEEKTKRPEASVSQFAIGDAASTGSMGYIPSSVSTTPAAADSVVTSAAATSESPLAGHAMDLSLASEQSPSSPRLCANSCGFYGSTAHGGLCSRCYINFLKKGLTKSPEAAQTDAATPAGTVKSMGTSATTSSESALAGGGMDLSASGRCASCNKKLRVLKGFPCKCGNSYCATHRYAEQHDCTYDYKSAGRNTLEKKNPVVRSDKLQKF